MISKIPKPSCFDYQDWVISEEKLDLATNLHKESVFTLSNGYIGIRGTFEEGLEAENTLPGTYAAGLFDREKVDPWMAGMFGMMKGKNIIPEYTYKILNCPDVLATEIMIEGQRLNMLSNNVQKYKRVLNLKEGVLTRDILWMDDKGRKTQISISRITSMDNEHIVAIRYVLKPLNYTGEISLNFSLNGNVSNEGLKEEHWQEIQKGTNSKSIYLLLKTKYSNFILCNAMDIKFSSSSGKLIPKTKLKRNGKSISRIFEFQAQEQEEYVFEKIAYVYHSRNKKWTEVKEKTISELKKQASKGFPGLLESHKKVWTKFWENNDIVIEGDTASQQGIRYSLFQLYQTYRGKDTRTSIGAKALSGEAYHGYCFWETELYMLPFFLYTNPVIAKNLLRFRYYTLEKAREKARLMDYEGAMFPFMTIKGEDNPGPWQCTVSQQHINAAIPYCISHYVKASGDEQFLIKYGAEIAIEMARFWASRVSYSQNKKGYVINQVAGPDEHSVLVNNNCYTNSMAAWTIKYAIEVVETLSDKNKSNWKKLAKRMCIKEAEIKKWEDIVNDMYIPFDSELEIHPQDDTFLGLDNIEISSIMENGIPKPIEAIWPWEKVLKSNIIKQPDVVLLMYLLNNDYTLKIKKNNYEFYEPKTIHSSSLSPSIHSIIASEIGNYEDAYYYHLRSARLDLDDYNNNTHEGIHIANAGGAWMSVVNGFAGMRIRKGMLCFSPYLPKQWKRYVFKLRFQNRLIEIKINKNQAVFSLIKGTVINMEVFSKQYSVGKKALVIQMPGKQL